MTVKMDFLISPAYSVPPMRAIFLAKLTRMKAPELVGSRPGTAVTPGAEITVNSGTWRFRL